MRIQKSKLETLSDEWFQNWREEMAAVLACGEDIHAYGKPILVFDDVADNLYPELGEEVKNAMMMCAINAELGGKHMTKILEGVALALVDANEMTLRDSYEEELNRSEAA
jgi:hypothetical protein